MNFFEHQEAARRRTSLLVGYYALAVLAIIVALYAVVVAIVRQAGIDGEDPLGAAGFWDPTLFAGVAVVTGTLILIGTLYKIATLRGGGETVAVMLGGRPIAPNTTDVKERRLLNVVEEMALAAGTPIPRVFLLDEPAINAFAAGFTPADAVIGVTRGTMDKLTRDELQGVIAHEFSHIFNGDMRLNIRLIGVLNGILVLAMVGYWMFRITANSSGGSRSRREKGNALGVIVILGLAMWIIGYIGVFFARLIKSAVSRQREYLADASAVQFTRNPLGIGGALKKIGAYASGSRLASPHAEEASHLFFANGIRESFLGLMATHPPLRERVCRIDPQFDGDFAAAVRTAAGNAPSDTGISGLTAPPAPPRSAQAEVSINPAAVIEGVGTLRPDSLAYATALLDAIPQALRDACHDPQPAQGVVYSLLLSTRDDIRAAQMEQLASTVTPDVARAIEGLRPYMASLPKDARLPLADMAIASLQQMSAGQYPDFRRNAFSLAAADSEISLFEYAVLRMLVRRLDPLFGLGRRPVIRHATLTPLMNDCNVLLSGLAWFGNDTPEQAGTAFTHGLKELQAVGRCSLLSRPEASLEAIDRALDRLAEASPPLKQRILAASAACVSADGRITVDEAEALRAVADTLGCPLPPLMARGSLS